MTTLRALETCYPAFLNMIGYFAGVVEEMLTLRRIGRAYAEIIDGHALGIWSRLMTAVSIRDAFACGNLYVVRRAVEVIRRCAEKTISFRDIEVCFIRNGHPDIDTYLLSTIPTIVNAIDWAGSTALMYTTTLQQTKASFKRMRLLIDNGADVNAVNNEGHCALMATIASMFLTNDADPKYMRYLITNGANVNARRGNISLLHRMTTLETIPIIPELRSAEQFSVFKELTRLRLRFSPESCHRPRLQIIQVLVESKASDIDKVLLSVIVGLPNTRVDTVYEGAFDQNGYKRTIDIIHALMVGIDWNDRATGRTILHALLDTMQVMCEKYDSFADEDIEMYNNVISSVLDHDLYSDDISGSNAFHRTFHPSTTKLLLEKIPQSGRLLEATCSLGKTPIVAQVDRLHALFRPSVSRRAFTVSKRRIRRSIRAMLCAGAKWPADRDYRDLDDNHVPYCV